MGGRKAWLVTWEWSGDHARKEQPIAGVYKPQFSGLRVLGMVEALYAASAYAPADMLRALNHNPYPGQFREVNGVPIPDEVTCGHNPWLRARLVNDLAIGADGKLAWKERSQSVPSSVAQ